jgi:hypothetical protein
MTRSLGDARMAATSVAASTSSRRLTDEWSRLFVRSLILECRTAGAAERGNAGPSRRPGPRAADGLA